MESGGFRGFLGIIWRKKLALIVILPILATALSLFGVSNLAKIINMNKLERDHIDNLRLERYYIEKYIDMGKKADLDNFYTAQKKVIAQPKAFFGLIGFMDKLILPAEMKLGAEQCNKDINDQTKILRIVQQYEQKNVKTATDKQSFQNEVKSILDSSQKNSYDFTELAKGTTKKVVNLVTTLIIIFNVFMILVSFLIIRSFSKGFKVIKEAANNITEGNLTYITAIKSNDEIGIVIKDFNIMVDGLRVLVSDVNQACNQVASSLESLRGNASENLEATGRVSKALTETIEKVEISSNEQGEHVEGTLKIMQELNLAISQIAQGAQEQAANMQDANGIVNQMVNSIYQITGDTQSVAKASEEAGKVAQDGAKALQDTIIGMDKIKETVTTAAEKIDQLGNQSQKIGDIVQVIEDIAEQTNLLALNAAIEAARAGEHGKGFAVVADEVRKLAENSTKSTKEISELINLIQKYTQEAIVAMNKGTTEVNNGANTATDANVALGGILSAVEKSNEQIQNIAQAVEVISQNSSKVISAIDSVSAITEENTAATEEMSAGSEQVLESVKNIGALSSESADSIRQVGSDTDEMKKNNEEISVAVDKLAEMLSILTKNVEKFRLS